MSESKIVLVHTTDWHLQSSNPPSRKGDYASDILEKIRKTGDIAADYRADLLTCGGDVFNKKEPKSTPHWLVTDTIGVLKSLGRPMYGIVGNHDLQFDREDTLADQPLGVLFKSGAMIRQVDQVIRKGDFSVRLKGTPFVEEPDFSSLVLTKEEEGLADKHVLSLHIYASPSGGMLHSQKLHSYADIASLGYDVVLLGHYHADQGVKVLKGPRGLCSIVNIGSLSRGDYGDENLNRVPKCCVVTLTKDTVETEEVAVGAKPAEDVFDLDRKKELKNHEVKTEEFLTELKKASDEMSNATGDVDKALEGVEISDSQVIKRVKSYIDAATELLRGDK